jgi:hypothetical protein
MYLVIWPDPLFAYSLGAGRIVVSSDRAIPQASGEQLLRECQRRLELPANPTVVTAHRSATICNISTLDLSMNG